MQEDDRIASPNIHICHLCIKDCNTLAFIGIVCRNSHIVHACSPLPFTEAKSRHFKKIRTPRVDDLPFHYNIINLLHMGLRVSQAKRILVYPPKGGVIAITTPMSPCCIPNSTVWVSRTVPRQSHQDRKS